MKIIVSGLAFGCAHQLKIDYNWLIYCSFGWILGSTYFWTKDIRCSIVLHMLVNLFLIAHCR
ncbi:CPBP family intramembrane glutamic endopeptidase [Latilactobacillus curvatus]|uniref:CPBP family intramembrane glutamic endopeptidase n=1 Tax=Latilactobacillus curvatus TaxID=28038 RepID=UPI0009C08895|nr:CPBP family intramembrane metalloprotease [Latilactobacillus curvatus]MCP8861317.1 CPBP family intramembrane metalloprotease [Latilactobacillus curvatus]MCS8581134.1 CPBP family intramembrane metalloprotease [Latilactobacillus curvatus]MCS8606529.1 CPBP family intramembrane metalloprotease [Latilactobacillus curvatus]MCT3358462.1 CPBP family intramembrane metalloprotease [Latilactobacillus curvatus]